MAMTQDDIAKANVQQNYLQATAGGALGTGTLAPSWLAGWAGWLAGWIWCHHVQQPKIQPVVLTETFVPSWPAGWLDWLKVGCRLGWLAGWLAGWLESPRKGQAAALTETFAPIGWLAGLAGSGLADLGGFLPPKGQRTSCCPF